MKLTRPSIFVFVLLAWVNSAIGQNIAIDHEATLNPYTALSGDANAAFDGNSGTRWESAHGVDPQWIQVELDGLYSLTQIVIDWEGANAKDYTIEISEDGTVWTTASTQVGKPEGGRTDDLTVSGNAKFVRMNGTARNLTYGYSIWEFKIYGSPAGHASTLTSIELAAPKTLLEPSESVTITATGKDQDGYVMTTTPVWSCTGGSVTGGVFSSTTKGNFTITATEGSVSNTIDITVGDPKITGATATASSESQPALNAVDGNTGTRWESTVADPQWLIVDLNSLIYISQIKLVWEGANASNYTLDISADGIYWQTIKTFTGGAMGGRTDNFITKASTRYVRMNGTGRSGPWGYSIYEFEVYGAASASIQLNELNISAPVVTVPSGYALQLSLGGFDQNGDPHAVNPTWSTNANYSINGNGVFTGNAGGTYTVTATNGTVSNTINITVTEPQVLTSIAVTPSSAVVSVGHDVDFNAQGKDQFGLDMTVPFTWENTGGGTIDADGLFSASSVGNFTVTALSGGKSGTASVKVKPANLAQGKVVKVSSGIDSKNMAVDGDANSRWESAATDPQWIYIDLGNTYALSEFILNWEAANAKDYSLAISADSIHWQTLHKASNMAAGARIDTILKQASARYVKMLGTARTIPYGYSLWEFKTLGVALSGQTLTSINLVTEGSTINSGDSLCIEAQGFDAGGKPFATSPVWTVNSANATIINGVFKSATPGTYTVTATNGTVSNTTEIIVRAPAALNAISIAPLASSVQIPGTIQFTASGIDQYGNPIAIAPTWSVSGGGSVDNTGLFTATTVGTFSVRADAESKSKQEQFTVLPENLVLNKPVVASSATQAAANAVDGSLVTRWESAVADTQWIVMDMAETHQISKVILNWEAASAQAYSVDISADNSHWQSIFTETSNTRGARIDTLNKTASARYLRVFCTKRNTNYGYSLFEVVVNGENLPLGVSLASLAILPVTQIATVGSVISLVASGYDQAGNPFAMVPTWQVNKLGASVDANGNFTATAEGIYVVTATSGAKSGSVEITVHEASVLNAITVTPNDSILRVGDSITYSAVALDQYSNVMAIPLNWSTTGGGDIDIHGVFKASSSGLYIISAQSGSVKGTSNLTILNGNVAKNKPVFASSKVQGAENAVDGSLTTRWESAATDPQWLFVDLLENKYISELFLNWEAASAKTYTIEISADSVYWQTVHSISNKQAGARIDTLTQKMTTRFLRFNGIQRNTLYGYSLFEFEAIGESKPASISLASLQVTAQNDTIPTGYALQLHCAGFDANNNPYATTPIWSVNSANGTVNSKGYFSSSVMGKYEVTATVGNFTTKYNICVAEPAILDSLVVSPANSNLRIGSTQQFSVIGIDQYGLEIDTHATWTTSGGGTIDANGLFTATTSGEYTITATEGEVLANAKVKVLPQNLALGKTTLASSAVQNANLATDGNLESRWESVVSEHQWLMIDFNDTSTINSIILNWEAASAKVFSIDISADTLNWQQVFKSDTIVGEARIDTVTLSSTARFFRINGIERNTPFGYSLFEVEAYGNKINTHHLAKLKVATPKSIITIGDKLQLSANGFDENQKPYATAPIWSVIEQGATITKGGEFTSSVDKSFHIVASSGSITDTIIITTVLGPYLTTIDVSPKNSSVVIGNSIQFSAQGFDQFGDSIDAEYLWAVTGGGEIDKNGLFIASSLGDYKATASASGVSSEVIFTVKPENIALNKLFAGSSSIKPITNVNDGNMATYWESNNSNYQWIVVDFNEMYNFASVNLIWNANQTPNEYSLYISADSLNWQLIPIEISKLAKPNINASARYVKLAMASKSFAGGYKLNEFQIYGQKMNSEQVLDSISLLSSTTETTNSSLLQLTAQGFDAFGMPHAFKPEWQVSQGGSISNSGVFKANLPGTYTVKVSNGVISDSLSITVTGSILTSVEVNPELSIVKIGGTVQFTAQAFDQAHSVIESDFIWSVTGGANIDETGLFAATELGTFWVTATSSMVSPTVISVSDTVEVIVYKENLALGKSIQASTEVNSAAFANDSTAVTYWESEADADQWIYVNFADNYILNDLILNWENNSASAYEVAISADAINWQPILKATDMEAGKRIDSIAPSSTSQFIRVKGLTKLVDTGYQLAEIEAYGAAVSESKQLTEIKVVAPESEILAGTSLQFESHGFDNENQPFAASPVWSVTNGASITSDGVFESSVPGNYTISSTSNGISGTFNLVVMGTNVNDVLNGNILIYSTKQSILIKNIDSDEFSSIKLIDINGKVIKQVQVCASEMVISTSHLQPGVYIVSVIGNRIINNQIIIK